MQGIPMSSCDCHQTAHNASEVRILTIALGLNALMAVVEGAAGWWADSAGLLADALDMLSDAVAYGIGLVAIGRAAVFKRRAAFLSGAFLLILGVGMLAEVYRRFAMGSEPLGIGIVLTAIVALAVNVTVLRLLRPFREGEVHLRATWIFTRADVVANIGVIISGVIVMTTGWRIADLIVGALIGLYVCKEALEIFSSARNDADRDPSPAR
jgi:cation diffusion facilitator family transporter